MPVFRKCSHCGKKVLIGTYCECEKKIRRDSYKEYKKRRMQDRQERERQRFYNSKVWILLSNTIKKHFMGMCVMCWYKGKIVDSKYTHHIVTVKDDISMKLDKDNCIALCEYCHSRVHKEYDKSDKDKEKMQNILKEIIKQFNLYFLKKNRM